MNREAQLRRRLHAWTWLFIAGLVLSGLTAIPIRTQFEVAVRLLGSDFRGGGVVPGFVAAWLLHAWTGIQAADAAAPFIWYGTDWLAFGHVAIGISMWGAVQDPVRNRWLYRFAMIACAAVIPWAVVFGAVRGIPAWWRVVDSAFGVLGFIPAWFCWRWSGELELRAAPQSASDAVRPRGEGE
jgi:hypothetical protein